MLTISNSSFSQQWVDLMLDPNTNFYDVQSAFNSHWENRPYEKGKGYKQYKRWEEIMEPRVYPSGNKSMVSQTYTNYVQWEQELVAAGIPKSTNGNWSIIGPTSKPGGGGNGRVNFVRFHPTDPQTMWVGTPNGGLWKTTNGGASWSTNTDQLGVIGCSDLAIHPTNPQIMYLATGDHNASDCNSIGVLKSIDGGNTWTTTGLTWTVNQGRHISRLLINPTNPDILIAFSTIGIFRTTNAGSNWNNPLQNVVINDGEFKPGDPQTVYACGTTIRRSTDGGVTWSTITSGLTGIRRMAMAVSPANPAYVYILVARSSDNGYGGLLRSTDSGASFTNRMSVTSTNNILGWENGADTGGQGWFDLCIAVNPSNAEEVVTGGINIWRSTNGGSSFTKLTNWTAAQTNSTYVHADIHDIIYSPHAVGTIFSGTDGGIFKTINTTGWSNISNNLAISQQYRLGLSASNANIIVAGHQDNGTNVTTNGTAWNMRLGGDGMDCLIDRTNNNLMLASLYYGEYYRSTNGGTSFSPIANPPGQGEWVSPIKQDATTAATVYSAGRPAIYRTTNIAAGTVAWTALGTPSGSGNVIEFAVAPSNSQVIYAIKGPSGTGTYTVSKTTNGSTFTALTGLPTSVAPTWVAVSNTDPNVVFVTYSGYSGTNKVFKSINGGTDWTNISSGLPNIPVNCVVYSNSTNDGIYVGTDIGVFYRDNSMTTWVDFNSGLPRVAIRDLEIFYPTSKLRVATYGRGTWESDLYSSVPSVPVASFTADNVNICVEQSVQFTSTSTGQPTSYSWTFQGGTPATSTTTQNPSVTYNTAGTFDVSLTVTNANGNDIETQTGYITVTGASTNTLPVNEGFTAATFPPTTPAAWTIINTDGGATTWSRSATIGVAPTAGNSMMFDNYNFDDSGNSDEMRLPKLNFTGYSAAQMTFHVAYAPFTQNGQVFADGLQIMILTDCGTNWTSLYNKSGGTVAAGNLPTTNPVQGLFTPTPAQWRQETIDLTSYVGQSNVIIAFKNMAAYGNRLFIDNINLTGTAVSTAPTASFTSTPTGTACTGQTIQYTSTSTGSPSSYSWTFTGGTPASSTAQNPTVTYSAPGNYTVALTATNSMGNNTSTQSNYITINQTPSITGTTPASRCGTGTVSLGATASTGTISWFSVATGGTALGTGAAFTSPSISTNTTYYVEVTTNGCTSARTAVLATVNTNPTVNAPATQNICLGSSSSAINFTGNSANSTYAWTNTNTAIGLGASGAGNIASFTPTATGTSSVTVTPTLGTCTGSPVTFTINVNPVPTVTFDLSSVTPPCAYDPSITLPAGSPAGGTFSGPGVSGTNFNPANAGAGTHTITYSVTQNGCTGSSSSTITVDACSGIEDTENMPIIIYPNPTNGLLKIEGMSSDMKTVELIDASGRIVSKWNVNGNSMQLDLSKFSTGNYNLKISSMDKVILKKIQIKK